MKTLLFATWVATAALVSKGSAQTVPLPEKPPADHQANERVTGHVVKPVELPPPPLAQLKVPRGFQLERWAENLGNVRILAIGPGGQVYVTRREQADVLMLSPGADGTAAGPPRRVASRAGLHGIAFHHGKVYLATIHEIFRGEVLHDGSFGPLEMIIHDLPDAGQHHTRTVQIGPDERVYIGVGSTANEASEPNPESATLLRATLDGKSRAVFASGLRDLVGWGWHPATGELWGMDHGIDWLGDEEQPEELNRIEKGKRYGWPYVYADGKLNPHQDPPGGLTKVEWKLASTPMILGYTAHSSPMQLAFYTGSQFPAEYRNDAFIAMRGSWNRKPPSGYEIVRIRFERDGTPKGFETFVSGFLSSDGEHGRVTGVAVAADGSLLFTDDRNGVIYRVSYGAAAGSLSPPVAAAIPAGPMREQNHDGVKEMIAIEMPQGKAKGTLRVRSPAFGPNQAIPEIYSSYGQNASVPLEWEAGPSGTRYYAILMEDPDAALTPLPVVHWVAWNIPAETLALREGLAPMEQLREPMLMRQGLNSMGVPGYRGPRPPEGDTAHRYFVQVFALDRKLELLPGTTRKELLSAMEGHVLAAGVLQGRFARPARPQKP
jgi:Raf kinase inhibitor-like YbhB/YbcL family protein